MRAKEGKGIGVARRKDRVDLRVEARITGSDGRRSWCRYAVFGQADCLRGVANAVL